MMTYQEALAWLAANDDTSWLDWGHLAAEDITVKATVVCEIYRKTALELIDDMLNLLQAKAK